jgi:hypothetical protein
VCIWGACVGACVEAGAQKRSDGCVVGVCVWKVPLRRGCTCACGEGCCILKKEKSSM